MDIDKSLRDLALLATRLALGGSIAGHGAQKMFGVQGGPGLAKTAQTMEALGFKPGVRYAPLVAATEITSGTLIALGALGPIGPSALLATMLVAVETVHRPKGYWQANGGFEMNTMYVLNALMLANEGYGKYSIDEVLGLRAKLRPMHGWIALAGGIAGALLILNQRTQSDAATAAPTAASTKDETAAAGERAGAAV